MTTTTALLTLEEYLAYDDGTDNCYELVDGKLTIIPPESDRNNLIALYLLAESLQLIPLRLNSSQRYRDCGYRKSYQSKNARFARTNGRTVSSNWW